MRHIREQRGLTLDQLADKARVSKSFLWGVEQDKTGISGERLMRVANVLGASLDFIMRGQPAPESYRPPVIEIPAELSELAEDLLLTHRQTLALLEVHQSIVARRADRTRSAMTKEDWRKLYKGVSPFLEEAP
jgi:transcriptional regulator with XRE-family HTH domain